MRYLVLVTLAAACGADDTDEPGELPPLLSELGLFRQMDNLLQTNDDVFLYTPRDPLWTNGAEKVRLLTLPAGETFDSSGDAFVFPDGTRVFKTFAYPDDSADQLRPIETRVMEWRDSTWHFSAYIWNESGTEATHNDLASGSDISITAFGETFSHRIPDQRQCSLCHDSSPSVLLGLSKQQLTHDGQGNLESLLQAGAATGGPMPSVTPYAADPLEARILGHVRGNCVGCHNGTNHSVNSQFDLSPSVFRQHTINVDTAAGGIGKRIVPSDPASSILFLAVSSLEDKDGIKSMPPVGVGRVPQGFVTDLQAWIESL